jgi:acyl carrier protein
MRDQAVYDEIARFFHERLSVSGPSVDADLFESGILDSLTFVDLVMYMEQQFGVRIAADELEPDHFRTIERIAAFVAVHSELKKVGAA